MAYHEIEDIQAFYLERIPRSEFLRLYMGTWDFQYLSYARQCWDAYDAHADKAASPARLFGQIVRETYDSAVRMGFAGDERAWGKAIKEAQPHHEK